MQMMSNLNVSRRLFDTVFRNVWLRKTYHLLVGSVLIATVVILDRAWFLVFCLLWLAVFGILSKRVSTSVLGLGLLSLLSNSKLSTLGAAVIFVVGDGIAAVVGVAFGMRRWPWGGGKTVLGSLAFLVSASIAMGVMSTKAIKSCCTLPSSRQSKRSLHSRSGPHRDSRQSSRRRTLPSSRQSKRSLHSRSGPH